jgi:hypothetical protein
MRLYVVPDTGTDAPAEPVPTAEELAKGVPVAVENLNLAVAEAMAVYDQLERKYDTYPADFPPEWLVAMSIKLMGAIESARDTFSQRGMV